MKAMGRKTEKFVNGIYQEFKETCKPGHHKEFIEDFSQIQGSQGIQGWNYKFRCFDCNALREESRLFSQNSFG